MHGNDKNPKIRLVVASKYAKRAELQRGIEWASNIYYTYSLPWIDWKLLKPGQHTLSLSPQHLHYAPQVIRPQKSVE